MYCDSKSMPRRVKVGGAWYSPKYFVRCEEGTPGLVSRRGLVRTFVISPRYTPMWHGEEFCDKPEIYSDVTENMWRFVINPRPSKDVCD